MDNLSPSGKKQFAEVFFIPQPAADTIFLLVVGGFFYPQSTIDTVLRV
jgi:hypothetical protein